MSLLQSSFSVLQGDTTKSHGQAIRFTLRSWRVVQQDDSHRRQALGPVIGSRQWSQGTLSKSNGVKREWCVVARFPSKANQVVEWFKIIHQYKIRDSNHEPGHGHPTGLIVAHLDLDHLVAVAVLPLRHTTSGDNSGSHHKQHRDRQLRRQGVVQLAEQELGRQVAGS